MKSKSLLYTSVITLIVFGVVAYIFVFKTDENTFTGKVDSIESCFAVIGGAGCTWIVEGRKVTWSSGTARNTPEPGEIKGFSLKDDIKGKRVKVHATKNQSGDYSLLGPSDYIKLL